MLERCSICDWVPNAQQSLFHFSFQHEGKRTKLFYSENRDDFLCNICQKKIEENKKQEAGLEDEC